MVRRRSALAAILGTFSFFWQVKAHGIQVVRLGYLGVREFEVLKELRDRWLRRVLGAAGKLARRGKTGLLGQPPVNERVKSPAEIDPSLSTDRSAGNYEATGISSVYDSSMWSWLRVADYCNQMKQLHGLV